MMMRRLRFVGFVSDAALILVREQFGRFGGEGEVAHEVPAVLLGIGTYVARCFSSRLALRHGTHHVYRKRGVDLKIVAEGRRRWIGTTAAAVVRRTRKVRGCRGLGGGHATRTGRYFYS